MKLTPLEREVLEFISDNPGHATVRKFYRIGHLKSDAYKAVFSLWEKGLVRAPFLRLYATPAGRATLQEVQE